jgi:hypothetical protein
MGGFRSLSLLWLDRVRYHSIVERCFSHIMPFNTPDHEAVRIFIVFSGAVGAWQAAKAFDGRFFGGRAVRARWAFIVLPWTGFSSCARFFDEAWVDRGILGMSFHTDH